jgi:GNAT superfamily N-acetyltransferase
MTSKIRVAGPKDYPEVWRLLMLGHDENALFPLSPRKVQWFVNRMLDPSSIPPEDTGVRGIIGVVGPVGQLEGLAFIITGEFWYTEAKHLEELIIFVDPEHRKSNHAKSLLHWAKSLPDTTGLPLLTGILSNDRVEAKCRLYQRILPKIGEFFFVSPKGGNVAPALVAASS